MWQCSPLFTLHQPQFHGCYSGLMCSIVFLTVVHFFTSYLQGLVWVCVEHVEGGKGCQPGEEQKARGVWGLRREGSELSQWPRGSTIHLNQYKTIRGLGLGVVDPVCALCPKGEIGPGGLLIEMCWRLIDVSAPVSGLFRTVLLIAGFTSHEGKKINNSWNNSCLFFASNQCFAEEGVILSFVILSSLISQN
ncbi:hypothetical protein GOODEAATRI_002490 [Goodea atripinnis]|uniref:Uncharacterized protein n=1 Tax=Goodea atripinnis TaxID=208336 RepID=A0ABV0MP84_9TELE